MKRILAISLLLLFTSLSFAQSYSVPKDYSFSVKDDYRLYEPQVKETVKFLLNTPLDTDLNKRKKANSFFVSWLSGSPDVNLGIDEKVVNFLNSDADNELLVIFMAGWVQYSLDNEYSNDKVIANAAGITAVVGFYNKNKAYLKTNSAIEKWTKIKEKGRLEKELKKILKI